MGKALAIALGAGVASALLLIVAATASYAALALACLTPLPIMITALGFGPISGSAAAAVGGATVALVFGLVPGLTYVLILAMPAWWLAHLALLARPGSAGAIEWYPVSKIVLWMAALAALPVLIIGGLLVLHYGGFQHALATLSARLQAIFSGAQLPGGYSFSDMVQATPIAMAALLFIIMALNLWLAGRIVAVSQRLTRPWPNLPDAIRLPHAVVAAFFVVLGSAFLPDAPGLVAAVIAAALGMAFVFEGLAAAHVVTRGLSARRLVLGAIYCVVIFLMPWPLLALALLGCLDCLFFLRGRPATPPSTPPFRS